MLLNITRNNLLGIIKAEASSNGLVNGINETYFAGPRLIYNKNWGSQQFISNLKELKKSKSYNVLAEKITANLSDENGEIANENIGIIGVVISGKTNKVIELCNSPMVNAATLGVTTDQY
ncbi:MAG: anti sigma factor C-terminal domain-containing protein [Bacillota bacterium]